MATWKIVFLIVVVTCEVINLFIADIVKRKAFRRGYSLGYGAGTARKAQFHNMMENTDLKKTDHDKQEES
ncbi:MAG: hypothetical protein LIO96_11755 [Lachnospiraceae bacterium]|nr:hypothetical protein [Lachnospiraceae bacterium]